MTLPWLTGAKEHINRTIEQQRLGHALLIVGTEGVGKQQLANWLARRLLCLGPDAGQACGECRSCRLMGGASHPDFFPVGIPEDKKEIPVDAIRALSEKLVLTPGIGSNRIGLINEAEAMNINAANALLKTLEEPADNAWLILVSHQPARLPATIRSRCQPITLHPPERPIALDWLAEHCPNHQREQLAQALSLSGEAPLAARELLEEDGLEFGIQVLDALLAIAQGQPVTSRIDEYWWKSPARTWRWLALWSSVLVRHAHRLQSEQLPLDRKLPSGLDPRGMAGLWEQALSGRALSASSVRHDLLMIKWLLEWEAVNHGGTSN